MNTEIDRNGKIGFQIPSTHHYIHFQWGREDYVFRTKVKVLIARKKKDTVFRPLARAGILRLQNRGAITLEHLLERMARAEQS